VCVGGGGVAFPFCRYSPSFIIPLVLLRCLNHRVAKAVGAFVAVADRVELTLAEGSAFKPCSEITIGKGQLKAGAYFELKCCAVLVFLVDIVVLP
jgi:hypothetical protein